MPITLQDLRLFFSLRRVTVDLMSSQVDGVDAFYADITRSFYRDAISRHRRFPLVGALTRGVALCELAGPMDAYAGMIEAAGRRNVKKAGRLGYSFGKINYNAFLDDIGAIRRSADTRQGKLPDAFLQAEVAPCRNPPPLTPTHDYPYFGVLREGRLYAYAGVFVAGELAMIEHIYGHAAHQSDGVVPLLLVGMADHLRTHYPAVRYYGYGSYFGASETLKRFKRKFLFYPYRVKWDLGRRVQV